MVVQKTAAAQSNFGNQFSRQRIKSAEDSHQTPRSEVKKMMRMLGMIMFIIMIDDVDDSGDGVLIVLVVALYCLEAIVMHSVIVMHRVLLKTDHCLIIDPAFVDRYN